MEWRDNLVSNLADIRAIARDAQRVAVLGIKTEAQSGEPAFYVPEALAESGIEIVPVPVYFPKVTEILGQKVYRKLVDIPGPIDIVDVFRRPEDLEAHVEDMIAKKPAVVWLQSGITHEGVAERLARAGIRVVQSRCLMVERQRAV